MSGYEVAQSIRHEAWGKDLTLIAVTGWGQDADKRRALASRVRSPSDQAD